MTRDPYQGSIYDPASLHRYNYARSNPVNFVDPSGQDAAAEYPYFSLNTVAKGLVLTATTEAVGCAFYSLGSAANLVGQNMGQQITQLGLLWQGCEASITIQQHAAGLGGSLLGLGAGRLLGAGIGWLLENAEEGFWSRLLSEEEGSLKPYREGKGHHVPAKSAFRNAPNYNPNTALAIPDAELQALNLNHALITGEQQTLYRAYALTDEPLTWQVVQSIETQALVNAGADPQWAAKIVAEAIQDLIADGVSGPTRIPWGG